MAPHQQILSGFDGSEDDDVIRQAYAELSAATRRVFSLNQVLNSPQLRHVLMLRHEAKHQRKGEPPA